MLVTDVFDHGYLRLERSSVVSAHDLGFGAEAESADTNGESLKLYTQNPKWYIQVALYVYKLGCLALFPVPLAASPVPLAASLN